MSFFIIFAICFLCLLSFNSLSVIFTERNLELQYTSVFFGRIYTRLASAQEKRGSISMSKEFFFLDVISLSLYLIVFGRLCFLGDASL